MLQDNYWFGPHSRALQKGSRFSPVLFGPKSVLEFKAVMVLPEMTVITVTVIMLVMHLVGTVITLKT